MNNQKVKIINMVIECFEDYDVSNFNLETKFKEHEGWDSLCALTLFTLADRDYGFSMTADDLKNIESIDDLAKLILNE
jgi:acyl carrier protein